MAGDDDDLWLDVLAGRKPPGSSEPAAREAAQFREAMLRKSAADLVDAPDRSARREAALLARAEREGLIVRKHSRLRERLGFAPGWAFAAVASLAVALGFIIDRAPPTIVERGDDAGIVRIEAADPVALKTTLLQELNNVGVAATGYERLGVQGIDAQLPQPVPDNVRTVLERHHVEVPGDGVLTIEIVEP